MAAGTTSPRARDHVGGCGCSEPDSGAAETCYCTVEELVDAISRKYALSILNFVGGHGTARFSELADGLPGISTSTLSDPLDALEGVGLLHRRRFAERPPRVEYRLSEAGDLLRNRLRRLLSRVEG